MAVVGTGISITFSSGFLAEILNVNETSMERASIDVSHMGSTTMAFVPGVVPNWGQLECEIAFDPGVKPPLAGAAETITITYANGDTWARNGFLMGFQYTAPFEDRMTATATIKFSDDLTVTPSP